MGSSPYWYYVDYEEDFNLALKKLREREFNAGRYNPVIMFPEFPITPESKAPGKQHDSIDEALEDSDADGTRSILDLNSVSSKDDYCVARLLSEDECLSFFNTKKPTENDINSSDSLFESIERGKGVCIPVFENGKAKKIFFMGYSFD